MNNPAFFYDSLYPLQDRVLGLFRQIDTGFYLTGGTAASRGYLNHRFSDDLDLFVNDNSRFGLWAERLIQALLQESTGKVTVGLREERFARLTFTQQDVALKVQWLMMCRLMWERFTVTPFWGAWTVQRIY